MCGRDDFVNFLCGIWKVPRLPLSSGVTSIANIFQSVRQPASIHCPPELLTHPFDVQWESNQGRLWIQVDCRAVAELLAGRATLNQDEHQSIYIRLARLLLQLHGLGRLRNTMDMILWLPREYKTVADHAVNATMDATMDSERNWSWVEKKRSRRSIASSC